MKQTFLQALTELLNSYGREALSSTPDFVLAEYVRNSIDAFNMAVQARELMTDRPRFASGGVVRQDPQRPGQSIGEPVILKSSDHVEQLARAFYFKRYPGLQAWEHPNRPDMVVGFVAGYRAAKHDVEEKAKKVISLLEDLTPKS